MFVLLSVVPDAVGVLMANVAPSIYKSNLLQAIWLVPFIKCKFSLQNSIFNLCIYSGSCWIPWYVIKDRNGEEVFKIKGPCCVCPGPCCTCDFPFEILSAQGSAQPVGKITKQYAGLGKEMFTDATNFSVTC